jgi:hypothetical protein
VFLSIVSRKALGRETADRMSVKSVMQAPSFKPELEFEIIKLVLLREKYLQRLSSKLEQKNGKVDMGIIGIVDVLRDCSVEIVETIQTWERTQVSLLF